MIRKERDGVRWLEFELLADQPLIHGTFTRHGGCSTGPYASLNIGRSVGDKPENVVENFARMEKALGISGLIAPRVVHGIEVVKVDQIPAEDPIADGVSTNRSGLGLSISHADCQAAIFYDPVNHALANVHCGWRGNVQNIYQKCVEHMKHAYGSKAQDLLIGISPSLGPDSAQFINYRTELPEAFYAFQSTPLYFDFWAISEMQLCDAGVLKHHIQIAGIDTFADQDYFSYRREKISGRQATLCALC